MSDEPTTPVGRGMVTMQRYLRWKNGNQIKPDYWAAIITSVEEDAVREYAHNLLHEMYDHEGEGFNFLVTKLHEAAGE